jgi:catalase
LIELPEPLPRVLKRAPKSEVPRSEGLSLFARPGTEGIKTRHVAILIADGVDIEEAALLHVSLLQRGAVPRFVGIRLGQVAGSAGDSLDVEVSMEAAPSVLWDALIVPAGEPATAALSESGHALEFLKDQYRHCKPILLMGSSNGLLHEAGIPRQLLTGEEDPGLLEFDADQVDAAVDAFIGALSKHRHFERETDPPRI